MPRHEEQQTLAYTADELFSVVANVKDYPSFVPWCTGAHIHRDSPQEIIAELEIGFGPFRESFTSQVTLDRPRQVLVRADGRGTARASDEFVDVHAGRRQDFMWTSLSTSNSRATSSIMWPTPCSTRRRLRMMGAFESRVHLVHLMAQRQRQHPSS